MVTSRTKECPVVQELYDFQDKFNDLKKDYLHCVGQLEREIVSSVNGWRHNAIWAGKLLAKAREENERLREQNKRLLGLVAKLTRK